MASAVVYCAAIIVALAAYLFHKRSRQRLPKGPWAWPMVGNGPSMQPLPHVALTKWAKVYGDIFTVYFGSNRTIVLSDPKIVREAFNDPDFAGKPDDELFTLLSEGPHGILNSEGEEWVEQRRFTLRHLRDFGFGKSRCEDLIESEIAEFIRGLKKSVGEPMLLNKSFSVAVLNTLWMILSGVRYEQDDPRLWSVLKQNQELGETVSRSPLMFIAPRFAKLMPNWSGFQIILDVCQKLREIVIEHIDRHKKEGNFNVDPRDFIDCYLKEIKSTTNPQSSFYKDAGMRSLLAVICDLFGAGSDTTSFSLSWLVLYLGKSPEVQVNVQTELDDVVGRSRMPTLADRPRLPYVEAVIAESMRLSSILPFPIFHRTMKNKEFHGYEIPKGTFVTANYHFIHHDERIWNEPEDFRPERFLTVDRKSFKRHEALMPFGVGKRQCIGETLARDSLFLFFTHMYHKFSIQLADESRDATLEPIPGFLLAPNDFKVVLKERL